MKNIQLLLLIMLAYTYQAQAQTDRWTIKPGENINTALTSEVKFHYPKFTQGGVFFRDGTQSHALLNYNLLVGEMQFIAPKGDTLAITDEATIKYIAIGSDTFFYDKVYLQLVAGNTKAKLARQEALGIADVKKAGAYDQYSSTSSITAISSVRLQDRITYLTENQEITILKQHTYYIGDIYNHFLPANKKNILKLFGKKQSTVEQYLKDNKIVFTKEEDLKALLAFLES